MNDGYLDRSRERHYWNTEQFSAWFEDNEDWLLEEFLVSFPSLPAVKDWTKLEQGLFDEFCQASWESECERHDND